MRFCAICIDGTEGLEPGEDGKLECVRCRNEHPIAGGYSFGGGRCERLFGTGRKIGEGNRRGRGNP